MALKHSRVRETPKRRAAFALPGNPWTAVFLPPARKAGARVRGRGRRAAANGQRRVVM